MNKAELKTAQEEDLWKEFKQTKDMAIRDEIVCRYSSLVKYVAGKVAVGLPRNVEFDDLLSYGAFGLLDAISKFQYEKGNKFKTYAITRIRGAIFDELRAIDWIPRSVRQKSKEIEEGFSRLENKLGRAGTDEELAEELGVSVDQLHKIFLQISGTSLISLNDVWYIGSDDDEMPIIETVEGPESLKPDAVLEREEIKNKIIEAIDYLPEKEKQIIALYYYEDLTLKEIGQVLDITESRVSQLHTKSILRLRSRLTTLKKTMI